MKKIIIAFISLFSFTIITAQKVSLGPEIGLNIIPIGDSEIGQNYQLGYHFGGQLRFNFSKKFKLSTGIFISQKKKSYSFSSTSSLIDDLLGGLGGLGGFGGGLDSLGLDSSLAVPGLNTDITETTNGITSEIFIEIPVLATYKIKNVNLYLGPYVGFLIAATRNEEVTTEIPALDVIDLDALGLGGFTSFFLPEAGTETSSTSGTDGLRSLDFGFNAGIGYEVNSLQFNLIYSHGLLDYRDDDNGTSTETLKLFRFSIAYLFDLKKKDKESSARFK